MPTKININKFRKEKDIPSTSSDELDQTKTKGFRYLEEKNKKLARTLKARTRTV